MAINNLRIGFVLDDGLDKPDGVQQYILAIGGWLTRQGHDVQYLVGETKRTDIVGVHSMSRNVRWSFNGNRGTMPLPASRKAVQLAQDYDILHVQVPYSPFMAHKVIKAAGPKTAVIGTFHVAPNSAVMTAGTFGLGLLLRSSLRRFDQMLAVSPAAARFAQQTFKIDSLVLPNVIEYPRFHAAKPLPQYNDAIPTILFLGRLVPRKGCQLLLDAISLLKKDQTFRVLICGCGPLEAQLRQFVSERKLQDRIEFVGFIDEVDKPRYYASADIAVFPSTGGESFGIVLLEAMASGHAAVLAGNNPGYRSVMEAKPELLFDPHDAQQLASLLQSHLDTMQLRTDAALWGQEYTKQFDIDIVGRQLVAVYRQALHKRNSL